MKKRKILIVCLVIGLLGGGAYAAFGDKAEILGTSVTVASADIKLLDNLAGGVDSTNLVDTKSGPVFEDINPGWEQDYALSIFNNGSSELQLSSTADYDTAQDVDELRQVVYVEPFSWVDTNADGLADSTEIGQSFGKKTVVKWKTEGYLLEKIQSGEVKSYVLRFSAPTIPDSKQGTVGIFSFEIDAVQVQ